MPGDPLLTPNEPAPVGIVNPDGASAFLLIGDHAGNRIPARLGTLGLGPEDLARHIAWDIGVAALGERLASALDATFIRQIYSRLVVDCNRAAAAADAIPEVSDRTAIPGNVGLDDHAREARFAAIHGPYHDAIAATLDRRDRAGRETILVALHSFTPSMNGFDRPWQIGILHHRGDTRFALACLADLRRSTSYVVGDNQPYSMDGIDYTIPRHAFDAGRRYVEVEIRQDLLARDDDVARWAGELHAVLERAR